MKTFLKLIVPTIGLVIGAVILVGPGMPVEAACTASLPSDKGQASYTVNIPSSGNYRVWSRIYSPSAGNSGFYLQIDSTACKVVVGHSAAIPASQFTWVDYGTTTTNKINASLSAGNHAITIAGYDPGVGVDKMLFLSDAACVPTGMTGSNCTAGVTVSPTVTPTPVGFVASSNQPTLAAASSSNIGGKTGTSSKQDSLMKAVSKEPGMLVHAFTLYPVLASASMFALIGGGIFLVFGLKRRGFFANVFTRKPKGIDVADMASAPLAMPQPTAPGAVYKPEQPAKDVSKDT